MAALPDLITVAQFREMPEDEAYVCELLNCEVYAAARPKCWHLNRQHRLRDLLVPKLKGFEVLVELVFRAVPDFDIRAADIGAVSRARWALKGEGDLFGAPELVIEVKSPSNTKKELQERASVCLNHGAVQFWILDEEQRTVAVLQKDGSRVVYGVGDRVPLPAFGSDSLSVDEIFG
jgi:Uma2 family endonuclease